MSKRIKRVFSNADQVIHLWANQTQSEARCRNVFFQGDTIYSYGHHFKLGVLTELNGHKVALINDTRVSHTTNNHISSAWHAVSHLIRIKSTHLTRRHDGLKSTTKQLIIEGLKSAQETLTEELARMLRRRTFYSGYKFEKNSVLHKDITEHNRTCKLLKFTKYSVKLTPSMVKAINTHIKARIARCKELDATKQERMEAKRTNQAAIAVEQLALWRRGGPSTFAVTSLSPQLIRVSGDQVETSRGAVVPLADALALLSLIDRNEAKQGDTVGDFTVDKVNSKSIQIGCHTIDLNEARAVLKPKLVLVSE